MLPKAIGQMQHAMDKDAQFEGTMVHQIRDLDTPKFTSLLFPDSDSSMTQIGILLQKF